MTRAAAAAPRILLLLSLLAGCAGSQESRDAGTEMLVELDIGLLAVGEQTFARARGGNGTGLAEEGPAIAYRSSDPEVLTVEPGGRVTGRAPGIAAVIAERGATSARRIVEVVETVVTTTVAGRLVAADGSPVDRATVHLDGRQVTPRPDGSFRIEGVRVSAGAGLRIAASSEGMAGPRFAMVEDIPPVDGGTTEVGTVALRCGRYEERLLNLQATDPEDIVQELGAGHWSVVPVHEGSPGATFTAWSCHCPGNSCWMNSYEVESGSIGSNYVSAYDERGRTIEFDSPEAAFAASRPFTFDLETAESVTFRVPDRSRDDNCGGISLRLEGIAACDVP